MTVMTAEQREVESCDSPSPVQTTRFRGHGWRGEFVTGSQLHQWMCAGGRPDQIPMPAEVIVRDGSRSRCARITQLDGDGQDLREPIFFKAYRRRPGTQALIKRVIGWHMPSWVWRMSWRLINAGVPIAQPYGYLVPQTLRRGRRSYFWSEWIEGAKPAKILARNSETRHIVADDQRFAEGAAVVLAKLHNVGVYHRDMNWGNLLVNTDSGEVRLIDLDSAHRWANNARSAMGRDLARFLMDAVEYETSTEWRDCFLNKYAQRRGLPVNELNAQIQEVMSDFYERRKKKHLRRANRTDTGATAKRRPVQ